MILVSEDGKVREVHADALAAKLAAAREDFHARMWAWYDRTTPRIVIVPVGPLHREPKPKRCGSLGIAEQLVAAEKVRK